MKVLILNGTKNGDDFTDVVGNVFIEELKKRNHSVKSVCLREIKRPYDR